MMTEIGITTEIKWAIDHVDQKTAAWYVSNWDFTTIEIGRRSTAEDRCILQPFPSKTFTSCFIGKKCLNFLNTYFETNTASQVIEKHICRCLQDELKN